MSENTVRVTIRMDKFDYSLLQDAWRSGRWPSRSAFIKHCIMQRIDDGHYSYFNVTVSPDSTTLTADG